MRTAAVRPELRDSGSARREAVRDVCGAPRRPRRLGSPSPEVVLHLDSRVDDVGTYPFQMQVQETHHFVDPPIEEAARSEHHRVPLEGLVAAIGPDASASEVGLQRVQHLGSISVLADREAWPHLPTRSQLPARRDGDGEASLSVDVAGDVCREELATATGAGV